MQNELVSVIVPIYNLEQYIERCIKSLINQTYKNIEILLIDDGSIDKSKDICIKYKEKDERIKYIRIDNSGVSNARNIGLKNSKGDFISFVDGDDYVSEKYIETLISYQKKNNYDIVISNAIDFNDNGIINVKNKINTSINMDKDEAIINFLKQEIFTSVCWGRLYNKNTIKGLEFDTKMRISEDGKFLLSSIEKSDKILLINERLYYYYIRNNSIMHSSFNNKFYDELNFCEELVLKYKNNFELYQLALKKELNFLYKCIMMRGIKNESLFIKKFNELFKLLINKDIKIVIKKLIINGSIIKDYMKRRYI